MGDNNQLGEWKPGELLAGAAARHKAPSVQQLPHRGQVGHLIHPDTNELISQLQNDHLVRVLQRKVTEEMIAVAPKPETRAAICLGWEGQDHCKTSPPDVTTSTRRTDAAREEGGEEEGQRTARASITVRSGTRPEMFRQR